MSGKIRVIPFLIIKGQRGTNIVTQMFQGGEFLIPDSESCSVYV